MALLSRASETLRVEWRTLSSCYPLMRALRLYLHVHTADLKGEMKQFKIDRQSEVFCRMGYLRAVEHVSVRHPCAPPDEGWQFRPEPEGNDAVVYWYTSIEVRSDDCFVNLGGDLGHLRLGVILRLEESNWQVLAVAAPAAKIFNGRKKDHWLQAVMKTQRLVALGKVQHAENFQVFELALSDAVELHLLLFPNWWKRFRPRHRRTPAIASVNFEIVIRGTVCHWQRARPGKAWTSRPTNDRKVTESA